MMDKLTSRKLWATLIGIAVVALNRKLDLGLSDTDITVIIGVVITYVASQGLVDYKNK